MHPSMSEAWPRVAREHEGAVHWLYLDTVHKVTAGIGTLLDDGTGTAPDSCLSLPWWTESGLPATRAQIASAWQVVKSRTDLAPRGGYAFRDVTTLRLDDRTIDGLLMARTREFWSVLSAQLVNLEEWPADAQLALMDMAYQLGPRFMGDRWPSFTAAAHSSDFLKCSQHCSVRQASAARNAARIRWFQNAAQVEFLNLDPSVLWDDETPKEDTAVALSESDLLKIRAIVNEELSDVLPEIWRSGKVDILKAPTASNPGNLLTPASVLEELRRWVSELRNG